VREPIFLLGGGDEHQLLKLLKASFGAIKFVPSEVGLPEGFSLLNYTKLKG
jgi:hypothetical protein